MCMCVYTCTWRPEIILGGWLSGAINLVFFETASLIGLALTY